MAEKWDRGAPTQVVQNAKQERQGWKPDASNSWKCRYCVEVNMLSCSHCMGCGKLRDDQREARQQERAGKGVGRGGGFFERNEHERNSASSRSADIDDFGRRASVDKGNDSGQLSKAERQKAALERLSNRSKRKPSLSPPRERVATSELSTREKEDKNRRRPNFIYSGGVK
eukprot:TRINITY_DN272_c1_g1_i1.p1 TRINITY_DN272_c1_g1~~TRINITY_DN272_c1_g1_i1.p1  ORF type:complete len:194 (-),score=15.37 TRINITY_DN272_c1_g1_i1:113-625(-)